MELSVSVDINSPKESVWQTITDFDNAVNVISGIEKIEVLEKPAESLLGFKWKETRTLFGKTATEIMWITEAVENSYYKTRAESHGAIYESQLSIADNNEQSTLTMSFKGIPQSFLAKVMSFLMAPFFKGATAKALQQDLEDIKAHLEKSK